MACLVAVVIAGVAKLIQVGGDDSAVPILKFGDSATVGEMTVSVIDIRETQTQTIVTVEMGGVADPDGGSQWRLLADGKLFENPQDALAAWVADWLFKIAEMGIAGGEWFGDDFGIISNGDNPDPLTAGTDMTTWLLLPEKPPFERFRTDNGDDALFYTLYPIHTSERDFVRKEGLIPLLRLFEKNHVYDEISLNRPPVA